MMPIANSDESRKYAPVGAAGGDSERTIEAATPNGLVYIFLSLWENINKCVAAARPAAIDTPPECRIEFFESVGRQK